jgi:hypothetical protein
VAVTRILDHVGRMACAALAVVVLASGARASETASLQRGIDADLGWGTTRDPGEAYRNYAEAARQGDADAELNLAVMNDSGVGRPRDAAIAALWYARAASHGEGRAAYDLGQLYAAGDGVERDPWLAAAWFNRAAGEGIAAASGSALRLKNARQQAESTALSPVILREPGLPDQGIPTAELAWEPRTSGPGLSYWVEVRRTEGGAPGTIAYARTELSSLLVRLPVGDGAYAWRVFAASERLGHYVASDWMTFRVRQHSGCCLAALEQ